MVTIRMESNISNVEEQLNQVLTIKAFLEAIPGLHRALAGAKSALLVKIRALCDPDITMSILLTIRTVIESDVTFMKSPLDMRNQRAFAVKSGIDGLLDVSRQTYKELTEEIHVHTDEIQSLLHHLFVHFLCIVMILG